MARSWSPCDGARCMWGRGFRSLPSSALAPDFKGLRLGDDRNRRRIGARVRGRIGEIHPAAEAHAPTAIRVVVEFAESLRARAVGAGREAVAEVLAHCLGLSRE